MRTHSYNYNKIEPKGRKKVVSFDKLTEDNETLKKEVKRLKQMRDDLWDENKKQEKEIAHLKQANKHLKDHLQNAEEDMEALKEKLADV